MTTTAVTRTMTLAAALTLVFSTLLVGSTEAAPQWRTLARGVTTETWLGGLNPALSISPSEVELATITHRDPQKTRLSVTWHKGPTHWKAIYAHIQWERQCFNLGSKGRYSHGERWVEMRDGRTWSRTWKTNKDLCGIRADVEYRGGSETPPGQLVVKIEERK